MNRLLKKLQTAHNKYKEATDAVRNEIKNKVDFDFYIDHQISDGFVIIVDDDLSSNRTLKRCLDVIAEKGRLSYQDYLDILN